MSEEKRKKRGRPPRAKETRLIRCEEDLAEMLGIISQVFKEDISDIVSPALRGLVERRYKEAVRLLQKRTFGEGE